MCMGLRAYVYKGMVLGFIGLALSACTESSAEHVQVRNADPPPFYTAQTPQAVLPSTEDIKTAEIDPQDLPEIQPAAAAPALPPYRLQVGDVLRIRLLLNPELDEDVIIRPDGMISTLLVQNLSAYGLTPLELQNELVKYYKTQLADPKLSVIVQSFAPTRVYVLGEVNAPGEFVSVDANPTVLQAIARAGGMLASAERGRILILRRAPGKTEEVFEINFEAAFKGRNLSHDMRLAAQDIVIVPRSGIANAYHYYRQYVQQFLPASFGVGYDLNE